MIGKRRNRPFWTTYPDLVFWGCYLSLNFLLFLPLYWLNRDSTSFWPLSADPAGNLTATLTRLVWWRNNLDIFRLNAELIMLLALWVNLPWLRRGLARPIFYAFFGLVYFIALSYAIYESVTLSLYQVDPVFYSQFQLALDGLPFLFRHLHVQVALYLAAGVAPVVGLVIIGKSVGMLIGEGVVGRLSGWSKAGMALLAGLMITSVVIHQETLASPKLVVSSVAYKLHQNVVESIAVHRHIQTYDATVAEDAYTYAGRTLLRRPDIYLIFVESYGSVLYKRPDYRQAYIELLEELQVQLQTNGWRAASALSEAPTWGGGSWMSYTSTLFGLRVDTHPQFLSLLDRYQFASYPDLGQFLKNQEYDYVRLSSLAVDLDEDEWGRLKNFYGVERWPNYNDLDFAGPHFGWGPAPPDQYALYYAYDTILQELDSPFFFFFVTQNSHYPWVPLPELVDDWRTLNQAPASTARPQSAISHQEKRQNYFNSINYELRFLTDYILKAGGQDSIFILIGDHQPQQVSRRNDSFDTPIHILSRDGALVEAFTEYGFEPGLAVQRETAAIRHEGFYSMFVRVLLARYGQGSRALPPYLPQGISLEESSGQSGVFEGPLGP